MSLSYGIDVDRRKRNLDTSKPKAQITEIFKSISFKYILNELPIKTSQVQLRKTTQLFS